VTTTPSETTFEGLARIGQIALVVTDLERAVAFYRDALGLRHLFTVPTLAFFDCAGVRLMIGLPEGDAPIGPGGVIYFRVSGIAAAAAALASRGVVFIQEPHAIAKMPDHELWMAFFRDPDGNLLALMDEVR
jgi:methylmalonyl-CoA/ethylmalonyl-CoA epimerase